MCFSSDAAIITELYKWYSDRQLPHWPALFSERDGADTTKEKWRAGWGFNRGGMVSWMTFRGAEYRIEMPRREEAALCSLFQAGCGNVLKPSSRSGFKNSK